MIDADEESFSAIANEVVYELVPCLSMKTFSFVFPPKAFLIGLIGITEEQKFPQFRAATQGGKSISHRLLLC